MKLTELSTEEQIYAAQQPSPIMGYAGQIDRTTLHMKGNTYDAEITDYRVNMQTDIYKEDFARMIEFLKNRNCLTTEKRCREFFGKYPGGVKIESTAYTYYVTFNPDKTDVDIYGYIGGAIDAHIEEARRGIRFLDEHYNEKFRISDGGRITIDYNNGDEVQEQTCRYIDDYHFVVVENNGIWHTSQFAEASKDWEVTPASPEQGKIKVLRIAPGKEPEIRMIDSGLTSLQSEVDGYIEAIYPYGDPVALICNEEGKIDGLPLNRALRDDTGEIYDVIAGTFLIVGLTEDDFGSLSDELVQKFYDRFMPPEIIFMLEGKLMAIPLY